MNAKKIIGASLIIWIVNAVYSWLTCGYFFNWVYKLEPIIWKSNAAIASSQNMPGSLLAGLIIALIFVMVFAWIYKGLPGKGVKKGLNYGFAVWLVGALSGMITMPFYMQINMTVVVYWIISALVIMLINGAIAGKMYKG